MRQFAALLLLCANFGPLTAQDSSGLRARGQGVRAAPANDQAGYWIGIRIDPRTRRLAGGVTSAMNALVEGY